MKTYLITGGAGFIGSNFVHYLLRRHDDIQIINLDKLTYAGSLDNLKDIEGDSRHTFTHGDICDADLVDGLVAQSDIVVNFAAESHVDRAADYLDQVSDQDRTVYCIIKVQEETSSFVSYVAKTGTCSVVAD